MPSPAIHRRHDPASQVRYQGAKRLASNQETVLTGTPGTLKKRTQSGKQYWVREYIRADGKKTDQYIGAASSIDEEEIRRIESQIELARSLASASSSLRLFGYQRIDRKPAAVIEMLANKGGFQAGLTLVGSHAYGVLLNELGIIAPGYKTEDIDLARTRPLAMALSNGVTFETLLRETGLQFAPIPGLPAHQASGSFKLPGAATLAVDLLVPGGETGKVLAVRELGAYAQTIPWLDYLVDDALQSIVLSPNQVIPVRVPSPERFLVHKLFSSQSRRKVDRDKTRKDLQQAAILAVALEEETPGKIQEAFDRLPDAARPAARKGAIATIKLLDENYPEAKMALEAISRKKRIWPQRVNSRTPSTPR